MGRQFDSSLDPGHSWTLPRADALQMRSMEKLLFLREPWMGFPHISLSVVVDTQGVMLRPQTGRKFGPIYLGGKVLRLASESFWEVEKQGREKLDFRFQPTIIVLIKNLLRPTALTM
jgi:hypothetical protein